MPDKVFDRFCQYFENRQYDRIPTDSSAVAMYGIYDNSYLYLINIIKLQQGYALDFERYLEYKQITMSQFANASAEKTVLLNLILCDNPGVIQENFNYTPDMSEHFIDVVWFVDWSKDKLIIPPRQLKSILGLDKDLRRLLAGEGSSYYDFSHRKQWPWVTTALVVINIIVWVMLTLDGGSTNTETLIRYGASVPAAILEGDYYRLFTSMFLHIGLLHLFHNMISLTIFGYRLEKYLKPYQYIIVYCLSGILGSAVSLAGSLISGSNPVSAGASGAVYGIMGALLVVTHLLKKPVDGVGKYVIWIFLVLGIFYSMMTPNIDVLAHLGGFFAGALITHLLLQTIRKTD